MTAQFYETLYYKWEETRMATEPLTPYLLTRDDIKFASICSGCWRWYEGQWEITENKLYLIWLKGDTEDLVPVNLSYLFPGQKKVFANWFSGEIRIPQWDMLKYEHIGYASIFERDVILVFNEGILMEEKVIDNHEKIKNLNQKKT